jgi:hypothetical protein
MAVSEDKKKLFLSKAKEYKEIINRIEADISNIMNQKETAAEDEKPYYDFKIIDLYMNQITQYIGINDLAQNVMGIKHEDSLDESRKLLYKILVTIEKLTTAVIDVSLTDIDKEQQKFIQFKDSERFNLIQRLFFLIEKVEEGYGENSKWKLTFVEIKARAAVCARNLLDYRALKSKSDPRIEGYLERKKLRDIVENSLIDAASEYRKKYEIAGQSIEDMKKAIDLLRAVGRLYILENNTKALEKVKKTIALWKSKLESDIKKKSAK